MEKNFTTLMTTLSDEGLQEYIENIHKYTPNAVNAAVTELKVRGRTFSDEEHARIETEIVKQQEIRRQRIADYESGHKWDKNVVADHDVIELFSQKALYGFTIAFGVLFGSVLMSLNLRRTSSKESVLLVILFGLAYAAIQLYVLSLFPRNTGLTLITNLGSALILNYFFWKKYIGRETVYRKRQVWVPLIIGTCLMLIFMAAVIAAGPDFRSVY